MPISGQCPGCKATLKLSDTFCGKKVRCIKCGKDFTINGGAAAAGNKKTNPAINILGPGSSGNMPALEGSASGKIPKNALEASGSGKIPKNALSKSQSGKIPKPPVDIEPDKGGSGGVFLLLLGGLAVVFMCVLLPVGGAIGWYMFGGDSEPTRVASKDKELDPDSLDKALKDKLPLVDKDKLPLLDKDKLPPPNDKDKVTPPPKDKDKVTPPPKDKDKVTPPPKDKDKVTPPPKDKDKVVPPKDKDKVVPPKDKVAPPKDKDKVAPPKDKDKNPKPPEPDPEPRPEPLPVARQKYTDEELTQIMEDLRGEDPAKKLDAADRLVNAEPIDKRRKDVARLIEPLLDPKEMNDALRRSAVRALGAWGDAQSVPILLERIGPEEKDILVKALAVAAVGQLKDGRAAEAVANALADLLLRHHAAQSLRAMGPPAEKAVLKMLDHPDAAVRAEACLVLAQIGTKASVPALENVAKDPNPRIAAAANEALKALSGKS